MLALAVAMANLAVLAPFYFDQDDAGAPSDDSFSVLHLNTSQGTADLSQLESFDR